MEISAVLVLVVIVAAFFILKKKKTKSDNFKPQGGSTHTRQTKIK